MTASDRLTAGLVRLAADGGRPPCGDPGDHAMWTSDNAGDRLVAVALCGPCPVIDLCGAAAEENGDSYVWGGRDYTPTPRKRTPTPTIRKEHP